MLLPHALLLTYETSIAIVVCMTEFTLLQYVDKHGQTETGSRLGLTQGAIWQMLKSDRAIVVTELENGEIEGWERKPIGNKDK